MPPEQPTGDKSLLDKPLHHLTEDDIAQITREDCRRYLKEKGKRQKKLNWKNWKQSEQIRWCLSIYLFIYIVFPVFFGSGMRRPSWNKSQAIQQVIMMKRLFEGTPDSDAGSQRRLRFSRPNNSSSSKSAIPESVRNLSAFNCSIFLHVEIEVGKLKKNTNDYLHVPPWT